MRMRGLLAVAAIAWLAGCSSGTYVRLLLSGSAPEEGRVLSLDLSLGGRSITQRVDRGTPLALPTDVLLEIASGEGRLDVTAHLLDAFDLAVATTSGSVDVRRGRTVDLPLVFGSSGGEHLDGGVDDGGLVAGLSINPSAHNFGAAVVGQTGASRRMRVTNVSLQDVGPLSVSVSGVTPGSFVIQQDLCAGVTLTPTLTCEIDVAMVPDQAGFRSASLEVVAAAQGLSAVASLSGTGLAAGALTVSPLSHDFGTTNVGLPTAEQVFTVTNTGASTTGVPTVLLAGTDHADFEIIYNDCVGALLASQSCTVAARMTPTTGGPKQASLLITTSPGGAAAAQLQGMAGLGLTVAVESVAEGATGKVVSVASAAIDCGSACTTVVESAITLRAVPAAGFYFGGWLGPCASSFSDCTVSTAAGGASVLATARFTPANRMFVTAELESRAALMARGSGSGNAAKMASGADALCQTAATNAGLTGAYKAWLSTESGLSARERIAATGARGWVSTGATPLPIADTLLATLGGRQQMFYPPYRDQNGAMPLAEIWEQRGVWTGSNAAGDAELTCNDWTSFTTGDTGRLGDFLGGSGWWSSNETVSLPNQYDCGNDQEQYHLLCLGTSYQALVPAPAPPPNSRLIFVTAPNLTGAMGGLAGADARCNQDAQAANLPGTYKALLATGGTTFAQRFVLDGRKVVRPDGVVVMSSDSQLQVEGPREAAINVRADGAYEPVLGQEIRVFTGVVGIANTSGMSCTDWTSETNNTYFGRANSADRWAWLNELYVGCSNPGAIYCLQE